MSKKLEETGELILEIPDRTITISESQLEYAFKFCVGGESGQRMKWLESLNRKIFGER